MAVVPSPRVSAPSIPPPGHGIPPPGHAGLAGRARGPSTVGCGWTPRQLPQGASGRLALRSDHPEISKVESGQIAQPAPFDLLARAPVDDDRDADYLSACGREYVQGGQNGAAGGGGVLYGQYLLAADIWSFYPALQAVRLLLFAHDEGVQGPALGRSGMHHRGRHRVRAKSQAAHRRIREIGSEF